MKYKIGDKVRIKNHNWYVSHEGPAPSWLYPCCGREMTIDVVFVEGYAMKEVQGVLFKDYMIEGLVEEDNPFNDNIPLPDSLCERLAETIANSEMFNVEPLDIPTMTTDFVKEHGFPCPQGYQFKDENGNIINATKIVLEKKKKEYPKTYEECCKVLNVAVRDLDILDNMLDTSEIIYTKNLDRLLNSFRKLLICRDSYWKIAGEEMGLGKPWKPDWDNDEWPDMYYISFDGRYIEKETGYPCCNIILIFPTAEMRDAFYENFKEEIEICKELL